MHVLPSLSHFGIFASPVFVSDEGRLADVEGFGALSSSTVSAVTGLGRSTASLRTKSAKGAGTEGSRDR